MVWKKSAVSYLMWLVYTLAVGGILLGMIRVLCGQGTGQPFLYVGLTAGYLLAAGLFVLLANRFAGRIQVPGEKRKILQAVEALAVVILLAVGLALRIQQTDLAVAEGGWYFEAARVAEGSQIPQMVHGASYLYLQVLHLLLRFLGNKMILGVWLQVLLQMSGAVFFYVAVRKLAGTLPGLVTFAFLMCSDDWVRECAKLSPEMLYLLLFSLGLMCVSVCRGERIRIPLLFLAGVWTGLAGYLDASGFLLAIFVAAVFLAKGEDGSCWKKKLAAGTVYLGSGALGFAGVLATDALLSGKTLWSVLEAWGTLYQPETYVLSVAGGGSGASLEILFLAGLMGLGIYSFWCGGKEERMGVWILAAGIAVAASSFGLFVPQMPGYGLLYLFCCVLAGVSLGECFHRPKAMQCAGQDGEARSEAATEAADQAGQDKEEQSEAAKEAADQAGQDKKTLSATAEGGNSQQTDRPKVKLIENPLPLPKKHERRVMDYARQVSLEEEKFDLPVQDGDDFDI